MSFLLNSNIPLGVPPPGVTANFINPENRVYQVIITTAICCPVMMLCLITRLYSKLKITRNLGWDDYMAIFAAAGAITYSVLIIIIHRSAYGRHNWDVYLSSLNDEQSVMVDAVNSLYGIFMFTAKMSLFILLLRIFGNLVWLRNLVYFGIVWNVLYSVACFIAFWVLCAPPSGQSWTLYLNSPQCIRSVNLGFTQSSINILCDFYLFFIPIPAVLGLQVTTKKKLGIVLVFVTGLVACIASCVALWSRIDLNNNPSDKLWYATPIFILGIIELNFTIICSCIPAFAGLIRHNSSQLRSFFSIFSKRFTSANGSYSLELTGKYPDRTSLSREAHTVTPEKKEPITYRTYTSSDFDHHSNLESGHIAVALNPDARERMFVSK